MWRNAWQIAVLAVAMSGVAGCDRGGGSRWEVSVENKSEIPCSCFVTLGGDGSSKANADAIPKGKPVTLIAGSTDTVVQTVRVVRGTDEQLLTPNTPLPVGKRYLIVVGADGKVQASAADR
jgi:hypothetical protein